MRIKKQHRPKPVEKKTDKEINLELQKEISLLKKENQELKNISKASEGFDDELISKLNNEIKELNKKVELLENSDLSKEVEKLKRENKSLKERPVQGDESLNDLLLVYQNKELRSTQTQNFMRAIELETEIQGSNIVRITRSQFEHMYNVNTNGFKEGMESLEKHGFIEVIYESERNRKFKQLKKLPLI